MDEPQNNGARAASGRLFAEAIKHRMLGLLIAGAVCLYFGFAMRADAPIDVSKEEQEMWYALDQALFWSLRIVGFAFLLVGAWTATGQRRSVLAAALVELVFAAVMLAAAIAWTAEARVVGGWDYQVILLLILLVVGLSEAKRSWGLYVAAGRAPLAASDGQS